MKKDIPQHKVESIAIAIVPREDDPGLWDSYIVNMREDVITNLLVNTRGYGEIDGVEKTTTILRYFFDEIAGHSATKIEPLQEEILKLNNEFWISYSADDYMYDKKYVFVEGSVSTEHFTNIPFLDAKGVMIK